MSLDVTDRTQLTEIVKGKSDDEIIALANDSDGGVNGVLDTMFEGMASSVDPETTKGKNAIIQYEISTPDGVRAFTLEIDDGKCKLTKSGTDSARVTMVFAFVDFIRMAAGDLDGMQAFMSGKLKLKGDMMFAQQMQTWFKTD